MHLRTRVIGRAHHTNTPPPRHPTTQHPHPTTTTKIKSVSGDLTMQCGLKMFSAFHGSVALGIPNRVSSVVTHDGPHCMLGTTPTLPPGARSRARRCFVPKKQKMVAPSNTPGHKRAPAASASLDLAAWGCIDDPGSPPTYVAESPAQLPQPQPGHDSAEPSAQRMAGRMSPVDLPSAVVRRPPPPPPSAAIMILQQALEWRSALACVASCVLLLHQYGVQPGALLPLLALFASVVICSQQAAASAAAAVRDPTNDSVGAWYDGGSLNLGTATLKRFGRAAFYCGGPGAPPCSPRALPVRSARVSREDSLPIMGAATASPASTSAACPTFVAPDRRGSEAVACEAAVMETLERHRLAADDLAVPPSDVHEALQSVLALAEAHQWLEAGLALRAYAAARPAQPGPASPASIHASSPRLRTRLML